MQTDNQTKIQFAAVLNAVVEGVYGKPQMSVELLRMWFLALQRYEIEDVRNALSRHVGDPDKGQFPPRPADIVRQIDGSNTGAAPLAWGKVIKAASQVGAYASVAFDDAAIHAVVEDLGGWPAICACTNDELPFLQRRFENQYRAYRELAGQFDYPPRLNGIHAINNSARGLPSAGAVLIGSPEQCRLVQERGTSSGLQLTREDRPADSGTLRAIGGAVLSLVPSGRDRAA